MFSKIKFKTVKGLNIVNWHNINILTSSLRSTGPAINIRGAKHRLMRQITPVNARHHFILNRIVPEWNALPPEVIAVKSTNEFKNRPGLHYGCMITKSSTIAKSQ